MRDLTRRIERLEGRPGAGGLQVVTIHGGFRDSDLETAGAPGIGLAWTQREGEDLAAFRDRVVGEARQAGAATVVIGGFSE